MAALSDETNRPEQPATPQSPGSTTPPPGSAAPPPPPPGWSPTVGAPPPQQPGQPPAPYPAYGTPEPPPAEDRRRRDRDGGPLWIGLVLIVFGIAVLAAQALPGVSFWMLWPLIIVAAGVIQAITPGREGWNVNRLFDGLVSIAFGLVLLGNTTGVIGWNVWWRFIWLWPVLLIAAGIGIIARAIGQRWIGIIGSILVILALGFAAATTYAGTPSFSLGIASGGQHELSYSAPLLGAEAAELQLDAGAGEVHITGGDDLVKVEASSPWGTPTASVDRSGSTPVVKVAMSQGSNSVYVPGNATARMDLAVSRQVDWDVFINSGAVSLDADLSDVPVASLELKTGVSDSTIKLGAPDLSGTGPGAKPARVKSGVSSVTLAFPADAAVRVRFQTGLSGNNVPSDYRKNGDSWESPSFSGSGTYWDVTVESGVGSSKIETY
jgi:hypothetical protein